MHVCMWESLLRINGGGGNFEWCRMHTTSTTTSIFGRWRIRLRRYRIRYRFSMQIPFYGWCRSWSSLQIAPSIIFCSCTPWLKRKIICSTFHFMVLCVQHRYFMACSKVDRGTEIWLCFLSLFIRCDKIPYFKAGYASCCMLDLSPFEISCCKKTQILLF